jgi:serine/threonine-protein kinase
MSDDWPAAGILLAFRYRLVSRLEIGGMAEIWHAQDELLARPVALKLPTGLDRARADVLQLPWREAATIGAAVAGALAAAHTSGVVHRDVKPGNVMLTPNGVKILDFGISAVTGEPDDDETGATFGTPAYVAPERLDGKPAEPATDVYGLGVLLFEMVTGQPPYPVDTWEELARARAGEVTALPETLPRRFRELVARCLVDEPDRRPTAAEVAEILSELAAPAEPGSAAAVPTPGGYGGSAASAHASGGHAPSTHASGGHASGGHASGGHASGGHGEGAPGPRGSASGSPGGSPSGRHSGEPATAPHGRGSAFGPHGREGDPGAPATEAVDGGRSGGGAGPGRRPEGNATGGRRRSGRRRLMLWSGLVALTVSVLAVFAAISSSRQTPDAQRAPATAQPPASPSPAPSTTTAATPRVAVTTAPAPKPEPEPKPLDVDVAITRVRSAVEAGRTQGQIRPDVAVDLLNLLGPLDRSDPRRAQDQVAEIRRKLGERVGEGSLDADRAEVLRDRLDDLDQAVSSG